MRGSNKLSTDTTYRLFSTGIDIAMTDNEVIHETPEHLIPEGKGRWLTQPYYERGYTNGFAEEFARAYAEEYAKRFAQRLAEGLTRLLEKRFKRLPTALRDQISVGDVAAIKVWVDRLTDRHELQSIFGPTPSDPASERQ